MKNFKKNQRVKVINTEGHGFGFGAIVTVKHGSDGTYANPFISCEGYYEGYMIFQTLHPSQVQPIFTEYYEQLRTRSKG
jgi:hypothetical protein